MQTGNVLAERVNSVTKNLPPAIAPIGAFGFGTLVMITEVRSGGDAGPPHENLVISYTSGVTLT